MPTDDVTPARMIAEILLMLLSPVGAHPTYAGPIVVTEPGEWEFGWWDPGEVGMWSVRAHLHNHRGQLREDAVYRLVRMLRRRLVFERPRRFVEPAIKPPRHP